MASQASPLGELRRALRQFLDAAGNDPQLRDAAKDVRQLDATLGEQFRGQQQDASASPGQRAAGLSEAPAQQDQPSPGRRAAFGDFPSRAGSKGPAKQGAQGVSRDGAKGQGSNLPEELLRRMKSRATARGGP